MHVNVYGAEAPFRVEKVMTEEGENLERHGVRFWTHEPEGTDPEEGAVTFWVPFDEDTGKHDVYPLAGAFQAAIDALEEIRTTVTE